ncbi:pilus assembly protein PilZ [Thioalkalivibrio denitrificans]|uniref:Pilus assembly protein PilZ n=1 Tax=Thioalkalivibrio denitrificans TaxID=108003 RepID=A0A1V3NSQ4_9GAMM|nr:PilZ domain-containing protein [Thioalkalivibrio denitrificans]OOG28117.1 pilus assembly protein PilZ [Thioalkalivibrio denitrificans]
MREFEEKRGFHRMELNCRVTLILSDESETLEAEGRDLSAQGFSFHADRHFEPGARLEVTISPENAVVRPLRARLEVVRAQPEGDGYLVGTRILEMLE